MGPWCQDASARLSNISNIFARLAAFLVNATIHPSIHSPQLTSINPATDTILTILAITNSPNPSAEMSDLDHVHSTSPDGLVP